MELVFNQTQGIHSGPATLLKKASYYSKVQPVSCKLRTFLNKSIGYVLVNVFRNFPIKYLSETENWPREILPLYLLPPKCEHVSERTPFATIFSSLLAYWKNLNQSLP